MNSQKIKVLFTIWTYNNGIGGHYQSLLSTVNSISLSKIDIHIVNIGSKPAISLDQCKSPYKFLNISPFNVNLISNKIQKYVLDNSIDVIHCYDYHSYYFTRKVKCKHLLTYPGGKNKKYFPYCENVLMFSLENLEFLSEIEKYKDSQFFLLKNRVDNIQQDYNKINQIKKNCNTSGIKILKIARIGKYYESSLLSAIDFSEALYSNSIPNTLFIIGVVENNNVKIRIEKKIQQCSNINIYLINDLKFTSNANSLIDLCDVMLSTGRGVMEGLSLGKIVLAPVNNGTSHVLVDSSNIDMLEYYNFSERADLGINDNRDLSSSFDELLLNDQKLNEYTIWAKRIFMERYSTEIITDKLLEIYNSLLNANNYRFELGFTLKIYKTLLLNKLKELYSDFSNCHNW